MGVCGKQTDFPSCERQNQLSTPSRCGRTFDRSASQFNRISQSAFSYLTNEDDVRPPQQTQVRQNVIALLQPVVGARWRVIPTARRNSDRELQETTEADRSNRTGSIPSRRLVTRSTADSAIAMKPVELCLARAKGPFMDVQLHRILSDIQNQKFTF